MRESPTHTHADESLPQEFTFQEITTVDAGMKGYPDSAAWQMPTESQNAPVQVFVTNHEDGSSTFLGFKNFGKEGGIFGKALDVVNEEVIGSTKFSGLIDGRESSKTSRFAEPLAVLSTSTNPDFRQRGFGTRRLIIINQFCKAKYGVTLRSSGVFSELGEAVWRGLAKKGLAKKIRVSGGWEVYTFV